MDNITFLYGVIFGTYFLSLKIKQIVKIKQAKIIGIISTNVIYMCLIAALQCSQDLPLYTDYIYRKNTVKYEVQINYFISNPNNFMLEGTLDTFTFEEQTSLPYQQSQLKNTYISSFNTSVEPFQKWFLNSGVSFFITLGAKGHVLIQHIFEVKVHDLRIKNIQDQDIGRYDSTDSRYFTYYGHESYHPDLIDLSNDIVNEDDNPIEKAEAIYNWIENNIEYDDKDKWHGALETYYSKKGVCLDFSELMIALLRIQGIPARMIHGYLLDSNELREGDTFEYEDRFSTHAWIQYYVPRIGWIACDPVNNEYGLNGIYCGLIATSLGGTDPDFIPRIWIRPTELVYDVLNHTLILSARGDVHFSWDLKITVLESDYSDVPFSPVYYIIYAASIITLCIQFGILILIFREAYCQIIALKKIKLKKIDKSF